MSTQELHRGRLVDHIQLVVGDLPAAQKFYAAILEVLEVPMGGTGDGFFWADELFVSIADHPAAQGRLTGRHHLAFQAKSRVMVEAFYRAALASGGKDNGPPGERPYHPGYYARSSWIRRATTSKRYSMARACAVHLRSALGFKPPPAVLICRIWPTWPLGGCP